MSNKKNHKLIVYHLISKFLFILVIIAGAILTYNGLHYSNLNVTINGAILLMLGITLYFLFHGNPFEKGFTYNHNQKKGPKWLLK